MQVKDTATRMLTNFSVQAGTNEFYTAQRVFKDASIKALPQVRVHKHVCAGLRGGHDMRSSRFGGEVCLYCSCGSASSNNCF